MSEHVLTRLTLSTCMRLRCDEQGVTVLGDRLISGANGLHDLLRATQGREVPTNTSSART